MIMLTLPVAFVGGISLLYLLGYHFSVAVGVGFIALAGVAVEIGVIMLVYLNQAYQRLIDAGEKITETKLKQAVIDGAGLRVRPVMMTVSAVIAGLLPILLGKGTGSAVMSRIATPMVGGMVSALFLTLLVIPVVYYLWKKRSLHE